MKTIRLTMAQALVRYLAAQRIRTPDGERAALRTACSRSSATATSPASAKRSQPSASALPTFRAHNEQAMAHRGDRLRKSAPAPSHDGLHDLDRARAPPTWSPPRRSRTSTACRCCCLPGDMFASRQPDPVLQQLEDFGDPTDHGQRLLASGVAVLGSHHAARAAARVAAAGDVGAARSGRLRPGRRSRCRRTCRPRPGTTRQHFFAERLHAIEPRRAPTASGSRAAASADQARRAGRSSSRAAACITPERRRRSRSSRRATASRSRRRRPARARCAWDHPCNAGAIGVTGIERRERASLRRRTCVLALGTRLQDFTTGSGTLFTTVRAASSRSMWPGTTRSSAARLAVCRAMRSRRSRSSRAALGGSRSADAAWRERIASARRRVARRPMRRRDAAGTALPTDAQVLGAVNRALGDRARRRLRGGRAARRAAQAVARPGAGRLPRRVRLLVHGLRDRRRPRRQDGASPAATVVVLVGDGSYLMMNSEIATSVALGLKLHRRARQPRLRLHPPPAARDCGGESYNNLLGDRPGRARRVDFAAHARALGAEARACRRHRGAASSARGTPRERNAHDA